MHPGFVKPQLATLYNGFPPGQWIYEVKFDGYRMQASREHGTSHFYTRTGLDWLNRFSFIRAGLKKLPPNVIIDGEAVLVEPSGRTNFSQLQGDLKDGRQDRLVYYAFDILYLDENLRSLPLLERKAVLERVLKKAKAPKIIYSEHHRAFPKELYAGACKMGLEGLIAKRPDAPYASQRNESWLKLKCIQTDQFVIVGYVQASTGRGVGALRLATTKDLKYAGEVGTGFSDKVSLALQEQLDRMVVPKAPIKMPRKKDTRWVEPKLVAKVAYRDITNDGVLRHASFKGLV